MTQSAFNALSFIPSEAGTGFNARNVAAEPTQNVQALQNEMMTYIYANFALTESKFGHLPI